KIMSDRQQILTSDKNACRLDFYGLRPANRQIVGKTDIPEPDKAGVGINPIGMHIIIQVRAGCRAAHIGRGRKSIRKDMRILVGQPTGLYWSKDIPEGRL